MFDPEKIFSIQTDTEFKAAALDIFRFQAANCAPYKEYIGYLNICPEKIECIEHIPFLPIELFKNHRIYAGKKDPDIVFSSSSTTGQIPSQHHVADLSIYEKSFTEGFTLFYGDPSQYQIFALLPNYLERSGSSLVYMADNLLSKAQGGGFFLHNYDVLFHSMEQAAEKRQKILLLGVSFALWEFAEKFRFNFPGLTVMETGGMKGRREEITRKELHSILCNNFGVNKIHSEYGMAELLSQAYSSGEGIFRCPPWMQVRVRDTYDPFQYVPDGRTGGINIIDLANIYSCSFLETQDLGTLYPDKTFRIRGRIDKSEIRGCNLMAENS